MILPVLKSGLTGLTGKSSREPSGYVEVLTAWDGVNDFLERDAILQDGGGDVTNGPNGLVFVSFDVGALPASLGYIFSNDTDFHVRRETDGDFRCHFENTAGATMLDELTSAGAWANERINILFALVRNGTCTMQVVGESSSQALTDVSPDLDIKFDYTDNWEINGRSGGVSLAAYDLARVTVWKLSSAPPDITSSAVQDNFFDATTKLTVDPAISVAAYGEPLYDFFGNAATMNAGTDQSTNNNNYTMTGAVTDV